MPCREKSPFAPGGSIAFAEKANAAVEAGAIATIIYNNTTGIINMDLTGYRYNAPAVSITQADAQAIRAQSTQVQDDARARCCTMQAP